MRPFPRLIPVASAVILSALSLTAQTKPADPDQQELQQYTLNVDNVNRYGQTMSALLPVMQSHSEYADVLEIDSGKNETLAQLAKKISGAPAIAAVLAAHGFTPRQFLLEEMAVIQASMGVAMKPQNETDQAYAQKTFINPANLAFVRDHQKEIRAALGKAEQ